MEAVIFVGPTLPLATARKKLDAWYCPPAAQGDVLRALANRPRLIGIIDGYFDTVPAVWHKEILYAMERGVHVFGAASMGALRAVELEMFGMVGIGQVFESFKSGQLEDDDEVALAHGPAESGYVAVSEAMVNIRHAVRQAQNHGLMTEALAARFLSAAKNLHYSQRDFRRVLQILGGEVGPAEARELTEYFASFQPSLKEMDAVLLLERAASFLASDPAPMRVRYSVENTLFLATLINEVARGKVAHNAARTVASTLGEVTLGELPDSVLVRREILLRTLARREAVRLGLECGPSELEEAVQAFAQSHGFATAESLREHLKESGISDSNFAAMLGDAVLLEKLDRAYDRDLRAGATEHIRIRTFGRRV